MIYSSRLLLVFELFCQVFFLSFFYRREREREEREKRESEKKMVAGGRGENKGLFSLSKKIPKKEKFWFLISRGALVLFILQNFIRVCHDRE